MSLKKREDGKYEVSRMMKLTNTMLVAVGDTGDEAQIKLRDEVSKYRKGLEEASHDVITHTGQFIRSPGYQYYKADDGAIRVMFNPDRSIPILARPDLAEKIRSEKKDG